MGAPIAELQRIGLKLLAADGGTIRPREFVPVFHRWIQTQAIADHLLIDVADYEHVPDGPGVLLAAHEGNFSTDIGGGRLGLLYTRKLPLPGTLAERLRAVARTTLAACRLLENDAAFGGRLRFSVDELYVFANDRLRAPNTGEALAAFEPAVEQLLRALYGDARYEMTAEPDGRERLGVRVKASQACTVPDAMARLA